MELNKCWIINIDGYPHKIWLRNYLLLTSLIINGRLRKIFFFPSCQFAEHNIEICLYKFKIRKHSCVIRVHTAYNSKYADIYENPVAIFSDLILDGKSVESSLSETYDDTGN